MKYAPTEKLQLNYCDTYERIIWKVSLTKVSTNMYL